MVCEGLDSKYNEHPIKWAKVVAVVAKETA
jgi:hypothetical protein